MNLHRRDFLRATAATAAALALPRIASARARPHIVVVGGGFGGATTAKYLRMWSEGAVDVSLIERETAFVSCPMSNLVIGGLKKMADITLDYERLRSNWGVRVITDEALGVEPGRRSVRTARHGEIAGDRLVLAPGVAFESARIEGLTGNEERIPHAWKAGPQTAILRAQLEAMPDGGVFAMTIPRAPYRCPPGPYERACVVAHYLSTTKPRSKLLVLDANEGIIAKKALFERAFARYGTMIEYRPNSTLLAVDAATREAEFEFERVRADVLNVIPPMRAGELATRSGLALINDAWAEVDWLAFGARGMPGVHVIGDAVFPAPGMPKSGHMANQHAKVVAAAILNDLAGLPPNPTPVVMNTCYSFVDDRAAMHVASVHQYDAAKAQLLPVPGAGGLSEEASVAEGRTALKWAYHIWADTLE
ncbi:NAD(P)/FAD-dependent oxidoreductase [Thauera sp.]|uniref:NAD(P)/FAD-dependent oxidoreductase n=1 Tax=Thauera sp. TaxID=1905334 RepID=UPI002C347808|nr:NAD(P)/FAD-dependent oxidoreductase [Thauera sp.]HRO37357.1 NAD(P)/FAD-dependent oxidoreductase [Thauera sp.]